MKCFGKKIPRHQNEMLKMETCLETRKGGYYGTSLIGLSPLGWVCIYLKVLWLVQSISLCQISFGWNDVCQPISDGLFSGYLKKHF